MKKLNDDLHTIHNIMRKTIDDVIDRGSKLEGAVLLSTHAVFLIFCNNDKMYLRFQKI
jgi:hypothetical protein